MALTLIIKGANFSEHYVEKVTFNDIPCTGISLNKNSTTLEYTTSTETLVATPVPVNTSDHIVWSSSNSDVVSVADGVISAVGIGTATITVTCGSYSDSCTVSCSGIVDFFYSLGALPTQSSSNDYVHLSSTDAPDAFGVGLESGTYHATDNESADGWIYPLIIPKGATTLCCRCMDQYFGINAVFFLQSTTSSASKAGTAKYIQKLSGTTATGWGDKTYNGVSCYGNDITLPSGDYDSVVLQIKQISTGAGDVSDTVAHNTHIWFE